MSTYTSFAVAGAGSIGAPVVNALLERNVKVLVLTRSSSGSKSFPEHANLTVAPVEYTNREATSALLREHGVEVVVSTLTFANKGAKETQTLLADVSKEADVKLFVPSEFGLPTEGATEGFPAEKSQFAAYLKSIGIPSLRLYTGLFQEYIPWTGAVPETGKFHIVGKGNTPVSFTSIPDIAGYLAHVLTTLPPSQLADVQLRIEGERLTLNEVARLYGDKVPAVHVDSITVPNSEIRNYLQGIFESGPGSSGWDLRSGKDDADLARSGNALWKGHEWSTVKQVLAL
ncbi:NAD(P)-binding protein [Leucogyrophana mollusca]|uniref:NAD(P)-binding protein n=1 Tax=Leucogyrophana mollusca TaxID=85980 RepID=A0ACB8B7S8_9AGAM|nr:NAD(P)-binding protein [Leucogyrophana mollusca]